MERKARGGGEQKDTDTGETSAIIYPVPRFLYTCAYDGVPYRGWQSQAGGGTVQDTLEDAFRAILREPVRIAGAGRTDAGVHALAQRFHADVPPSNRMSAENWRDALNAHLPADIRIVDVSAVDERFHARFNAVGKEYSYRLATAKVLSPFLRGRAWHCPRPLDSERLRHALSLYLGTHNFRRLSARRGNEPEPAPPDYYERTLTVARAEEETEGVLRLDFHGNGFMYRMVRMLVGTAVQVAWSRLSVQELAALMNAPGPTTRHCAPPEGLYLTSVRY